MRLRSRPVCAPISAASGPMPAMKGRRFSATRAMAASNRPAGAGFPAGSCTSHRFMPAGGWPAAIAHTAGPALLRHRHVPDPHGLLFEGLGQIGVDRRRGQPVGRAVVVRIGVGHLADARQPHRRHAHGTGMAAGIDRAAAQVRRAQLAAGGAHGHQLGMRGGVVRGQDFIDAGGQHLAVAHQHRAEGTPAGGDVGAGQLDGHVQEMQGIAHVFCSGFARRRASGIRAVVRADYSERGNI